MTVINNQAGQLDPSFGINGKLDILTPGNFRNDLSNLKIDTSGRLLIYGAYERETPIASLPGAGRLMDDGAFDTRFGDSNDGLTTPSPNILPIGASDLAMLADGSFFITGAANSQLPLINYDGDGKYISNWDIAEGPQYAIPRLLAVDNTFLVTTANANGGLIYRRNFDGGIDSSFGTEGKATFLTGSSYISTLHMARSVTGSSFYLAGEAGNDGFILRMTESGELDQSFAHEGVHLIRIIGARFTGCRRIIPLSDGKILALINSSGSESGPACHLIRLTADGRIDATFNRGEPLRVAGEVGEDMALQADGRILVAHRSLATGNTLTRYVPIGGVDTGFGGDGSGSITFTSEQLSFVKSVAVQPDGKIVVGGTFGSITTLLRLLP